MKTLEDFKGTKEPMIIKESADAIDIFAGSNIAVFRRNETGEANVKLFANSYKLLEAAVKAKEFLQYANNNSRQTETSEFWQELLNVRIELEQAIQDCL